MPWKRVDTGSGEITQTDTFIAVHPVMHTQLNTAVRIFEPGLQDRVVTPWRAIKFRSVLMTVVCIRMRVAKDVRHHRTAGSTEAGVT